MPRYSLEGFFCCQGPATFCCQFCCHPKSANTNSTRIRLISSIGTTGSGGFVRTNDRGLATKLNPFHLPGRQKTAPKGRFRIKAWRRRRDSNPRSGFCSSIPAVRHRPSKCILYVKRRPLNRRCAPLFAVIRPFCCQFCCQKLTCTSHVEDLHRPRFSSPGPQRFSHPSSSEQVSEPQGAPLGQYLVCQVNGLRQFRGKKGGTDPVEVVQNRCDSRRGP
jgi:hypothetical protein